MWDLSFHFRLSARVWPCRCSSELQSGANMHGGDADLTRMLGVRRQLGIYANERDVGGTAWSVIVRL